MEFLPSEIIVCILSKVTIMELGDLKCVCKSWKKMIKGIQPALILLHRGSPSKSNLIDDLILIVQDDIDLKDLFCTYLADCKMRGFRQKVLIRENVMDSSGLEIVGSCNGLLCLLDGISWPRILVMNPLTNQSIWLPNLDLINWHGRYVVTGGFGYNPNTNSYKVIVILETTWNDESQAIMFDSETNNWRSVGKRHHSFRRAYTSFNPGILLNGRLHWITEQEIVSFDLIDEKFASIEMPKHLFGGKFCDLIVFKGCLCIVRQNFPYHKEVQLQIWVMKQYGIETSWETLARRSTPIIGGTPCFKVLGEVENGKILVKRDGTMLLYDPLSTIVTFLEYQQLPKGCNSIIHVPTLDWPHF